MIINGSIYITDDPNIAMNGLTSNTILLTMEEGQSIFNLNANNIIKSTILLPPPDVLISLVNGDAELATNMYYGYLGAPHVREFVNTMMMVLYKGQNVLIFSPKTDFSDIYNGLLCNWFMINYGLIIGYGNNNFQFDISFTWFIVTALYLDGYLSVDEFGKEYPNDVQIDPNALGKLIAETGTTIPEATNAKSAEEYNVFYQRYFMEMVKKLKTKATPFHFVSTEEPLC